jgi:hypothetical protein
MEFSATIDNKRIFKKPNGDEVVDFTQQRFNPGQGGTIYDYVIVSDEFSMRPDLIAQVAYSDPETLDLVMKTNAVSNPFSIDQYDIFFFQERRQLAAKFSEGAKAEVRDKIRNQYLDPSKAPVQDANLKAFNNRQKPKKPKLKEGPALPPNYANFGDKEISLKGGKVIFGGDVTNNSQESEEKPLAKTEFLKKIARNKLNATGEKLQKGRVEIDARSLRDPGSIVDQNSLAAPSNVSKSVTDEIVKNATKGTS